MVGLQERRGVIYSALAVVLAVNPRFLQGT
jgi:hypothetical protein